MKLSAAAPFAELATVADFSQHYSFATPSHPQLAVIDLAQYPLADFPAKPALRHLYLVMLKRHFHGQLSYGQQVYDYQRGVLGFYAPGQPVQLCPVQATGGVTPHGWWYFTPTYCLALRRVRATTHFLPTACSEPCL